MYDYSTVQNLANVCPNYLGGIQFWPRGVHAGPEHSETDPGCTGRYGNRETTTTTDRMDSPWESFEFATMSKYRLSRDGHSLLIVTRTTDWSPCEHILRRQDAVSRGGEGVGAVPRVACG